jgi:hypothetical protein
MLDIEAVRDYILDTVSEAGISLNESGLEAVDRKLDRIRLSLAGTDLEGDELDEEVKRLLGGSW